MKKRLLLVLLSTTAGMLLLSGCGAAATASQSTAQVKTDTYLTIATGDQIGKAEWPVVLPSNFTLPANATVTVHIANFDDADDMSDPGLVNYSKVSGTVGGTVTVQSFKDDNPNTLDAAQTSAQLDPKTSVSHTLTIPDLNLNVPIAPHGVTTFTIKTGAAGTYTWQCLVPCGTDPNGNGGPMISAGYMKGTLTIA